MSERPEASRRAASAVMQELARAGVREACISPGSRSTPLVLALAAESSIRIHVVDDERSAGFFALGAARESGAPVALVCTSGTAAANYLPAVAEASLAGVPLLVLTADRPPELRDCGAAQTIDQVRLFGSHVRWSVDVAVPEPGGAPEAYYRALACRAAAVAQAPAPGPVHLNLPFREPFLDADPAPVAVSSDACDTQPYLSVIQGEMRISPARIDALVAGLASVERGLVVCGRGCGGPAVAADLARLAAALGWPLLADPLSGLRACDPLPATLVDAYDLVLRSPRLADGLRPDAVVQFGSLPASKPLLRLLEAARPRPWVTVAPASWPDPLHATSHLLRGDPPDVARELADRLGPAPTPGAWLRAWTAVSARARDAVEGLLERGAGPAEGSALRALSAALPAGAALHCGNSMPIRDLDTFVPARARGVEFFANRGANGIDGVVSTALGAAAVATRPVALAVGDLSFLHDIGGLRAAVRGRIDLLVVVLNNDGGAIFTHLPQAALGETFDRYFLTPHGLDASAAERLGAAGYAKVSTVEELVDAARAALDAGGLQVVELTVDRERNFAAAAFVVDAACVAAEAEPLP